MKESLIQAGLTATQANTYLFLLNNCSPTAPAVAAGLGLTRSNAYKVLEQLMALGLAKREEKQKKFVYAAGDPQALNDMLAVERNRYIVRENAVKSSLDILNDTYQQRSAGLEARTFRGIQRLKKLYEHQIGTQEPVYYIRSRHDVLAMGHDTMTWLYYQRVASGTQRFGITPDAPEAPADPEVDKASHLTRTWIDCDDYTAPVEWSVSGDEVTLFIFENDGGAIRIKNRAVADSLRQLWQLLDRNIRQQPGYSSMPHKAKRKF